MGRESAQSLLSVLYGMTQKRKSLYIHSTEYDIQYKIVMHLSETRTNY